MTKRSIIIGLVIVLILIGLAYYFYQRSHQCELPLTLYGNVDIRDVNVGFRVNGRLIAVLVDEGDAVHPGQLIARLDPEPYQLEVNSFAAKVDQQKASLAYAETVFAREQKMLGTGASSVDRYKNAVSERDQASANLKNAIADLAQARLHVSDTNLYSPSPGVILTRAVEPGTMLAVNATVLDITLTNTVWVRAYVAESDLGKAKPGTEVTVFTDSNPNKVYQGKIGFVSPTAEFTPKTVETPELRTDLVYRLRIVMQDPKHELRQGMPVTVKLRRKNHCESFWSRRAASLDFNRRHRIP